MGIANGSIGGGVGVAGAGAGGHHVTKVVADAGGENESGDEEDGSVDWNWREDVK